MQKTFLVSDLSGETITDDEAVTVVVKDGDVRQVLDLSRAEANALFDGKGRVSAKRGRKATAA